jgi:hypothetical protein
MKDPRSIDIILQQIKYARRAFERGLERPMSDSTLDGVVKHLQVIVWEYENWTGKGASKARLVLVPVANALAQLYSARTSRQRWERRTHLEFAGGAVDEAYVAFSEMG